MAVPQAPPKRKEIYKYNAPWTVYGMNWSVRPDKKFRLALGSFIEEYSNKVCFYFIIIFSASNVILPSKLVNPTCEGSLSLLHLSRKTTKGSSIKYVCKIFRKANISNPLIRSRTCAYQRVRNVRFSENFAYVLNG